MQPYNYNIDIATPFDTMLRGYQAGSTMRDMAEQREFKQQQMALAVQEAQQKQAAQASMQQDLALLARNPNPTARDYTAVMTKYPQLSEHFKKSWDILSADQQQQKLQDVTKVYSALQNGSPQTAVDFLREQATALRNTGKEQEAKASEALARTVELQPGTARTMAGAQLAALMGADKFAAMQATMGGERRAEQVAPFEVQKRAAEATKLSAEALNSPQRLALENTLTAGQVRAIDAKIENDASRLALDRDKLQSEVQMKLHEMQQKGTTLTDDARKLVNESAQASVTAGQTAGKMEQLAEKLNAVQITGGVFARGSEAINRVFGGQDELTRLRNEYTRLRSTQVLKNLPPGPATDRDIEIASRGFPDETANKDTIVAFLRGMAKLNRIEGDMSNAKAEWANAVGHLGRAANDIEIDGVRVPARTTFAEFTNKYLERKQEGYQAQEQVRAVQNRPYAKYATPAQQPARQ